MLTRLLITLDACFAFISYSPAIALIRAPLVMAFLLLAFAAFMALGGNMLKVLEGRGAARETRFAQKL